MNIIESFENLRRNLRYTNSVGGHRNSVAWVGNLPHYSVVDTEYDVLFKYTKMKYAQTMLKDGVFRIGTLYEYQGMEAGEIGDPDEGFKGTYVDTTQPTAPQLDEFFRLHKYMDRSRMPSLANIHDGIPIALHEMAPDMYLFCLTRKFDRAAMERFGYDACLEIRRPKEFLRSLNEAMFPYAYSGCLNTCQYIDRVDLVSAGRRPAPQYIKGTAFEHQQEVRLIWDPWPLPSLHSEPRSTPEWNYWTQGRDLERPMLKAPLYITHPPAAEFCRLIF